MKERALFGSLKRNCEPNEERQNLPDWLLYPDTEWETAAPAEAGLNTEAFNQWVKSKPYTIGGLGERSPVGMGAVLTRGGKIVATNTRPDVAPKCGRFSPLCSRAGSFLCGKAFHVSDL